MSIRGELLKVFIMVLKMTIDRGHTFILNVAFLLTSLPVHTLASVLKAKEDSSLRQVVAFLLCT